MKSQLEFHKAKQNIKIRKKTSEISLFPDVSVNEDSPKNYFIDDVVSKNTKRIENISLYLTSDKEKDLYFYRKEKQLRDLEEQRRLAMIKPDLGNIISNKHVIHKFLRNSNHESISMIRGMYHGRVASLNIPHHALVNKANNLPFSLNKEHFLGFINREKEIMKEIRENNSEELLRKTYVKTEYYNQNKPKKTILENKILSFSSKKSRKSSVLFLENNFNYLNTEGSDNSDNKLKLNQTLKNNMMTEYNKIIVKSSQLKKKILNTSKTLSKSMHSCLYKNYKERATKEDEILSLGKKSFIKIQNSYNIETQKKIDFDRITKLDVKNAFLVRDIIAKKFNIDDAKESLVMKQVTTNNSKFLLNHLNKINTKRQNINKKVLGLKNKVVNMGGVR